jgi:hypothetical protein
MPETPEQTGRVLMPLSGSPGSAPGTPSPLADRAARSGRPAVPGPAGTWQRWPACGLVPSATDIDSQGAIDISVAGKTWAAPK